MDNKLTVKQYKIILDELDLEMAKELSAEMEDVLGEDLQYSSNEGLSVFQGILKQIINQSNNEQTESRQDS
tara:strand:+ start:727 stop:939 length:213 start_codon:yes stop_codon:yes gene_type:complete